MPGKEGVIPTQLLYAQSSAPTIVHNSEQLIQPINLYPNTIGTQEPAQSHPTLEDAALLQTIQLYGTPSAENSEHVTGLIAARYTPELTRYVNYLVKDPYVTEEILQEVLVAFHQEYTQAKLNLESLPTGWLFQVAHNKAASELRKNLRRSRHFIQNSCIEPGDSEDNLLYTIPDGSSSTDDIVETREEREVLLASIDRLPSKIRTIVLLRYQNEISYKEIAEILHMNENTAKVYYHRALYTLRKILAEKNYQR